MNAKKAIEAYQALLVDLRHVVDDMAAVEEARAEVEPEGGNGLEDMLLLKAVQDQARAVQFNGDTSAVEVRLSASAHQISADLAEHIPLAIERLAAEAGDRAAQRFREELTRMLAPGG